MSNSPKLQLIPVASIRPSPYQYRTRFDDEEQQQRLMESMRAAGLSTPILVRPLSTRQTDSGQRPQYSYELVSGERRWRGAKALGWESILAICEEMTDAEAAARVVTENEVRSDTNVMEKAAGYKRLTEPPCSMTLEEIAKQFGLRAASSVKRIIDLLDQPEPIRDFLSRDKIGERHIRSLNRLEDLNTRTQIAKRAAEEDWTVKATEEQVAKLLAQEGKSPRKAPKPAPSREYDYNGFHCALIGDEVVISGRNFKLNRELVRQFAEDYKVALECFVRDIHEASGELLAAEPVPLQGSDNPTASDASPGRAEVAPAADIVNPAEVMKQAAEAEASPPLKELFSDIAKALGSAGEASKEGGNPGLADLLSLFGKPKSSG